MEAGITTLAGVAGWVTDLGSPALARLGTIYISGFMMGWSLAAVPHTRPRAPSAHDRRHRPAEKPWLVDDGLGGARTARQGKPRRRATGAEGIQQFLMGCLPVASAAAVGVFVGFRESEWERPEWVSTRSRDSA